jgi:hypothetical protein
MPNKSGGAAGKELLQCPECKSGDKLRHIKQPDCYRCSKCSNEWFPDEVIRVPYKTAKFTNSEGREVFIQLTPEKIAEWKERQIGYYAPSKRNELRGENGKYARTKRPASSKLSKREKRDLNRLRRHRK